MLSLENAVTSTLEELELDEIFEYDIREVQEDTLYHVTFREKQNGNNIVVVSVEYSNPIGEDLMNDEEWEGELEVKIIDRYGVAPMMSQLMTELLAISIDADYFDSDDEDSDDEDSDDETLSLPSQPRTPPPRPSLTLVPPPLPRRYR
jgi:hypothetical protein